MKGRILTSWAVLLMVGSCAMAGPARAQDYSEEPLTRFAFGSCNRQWEGQGHWLNIAALQPQMWVWAGDTIYADHLPVWVRQEQYNWLRNSAEYSSFIQGRFITGTWDDHDYGSNNVGGEYGAKEESQRLFLSFLDEPWDSPRWRHPGVYGSWLMGPPGRRVKVILLDLRYFREAPGESSAMLGETQWEWLTAELFADDAQLTFLVSSSQILADEHHSDSWGQYPVERARLMGLLAASPGRVIALSGDRHFAEISRASLPDGRAFYDFTSSGLTHATPLRVGPNRFRRGSPYAQTNFGFVTIDWDTWGGDPAVSLQIRAADTGEAFYEELVQWR